jgi:phospholipid/cholesterol/gamma-HCH transport system permease protein
VGADVRQQQVAPDLAALPEGLRDLLHLASSSAVPAAPAAPAAPWQQAMVTVAFVGSVLLAALRWLQGRAAPRWGDVLRQVDEAGPRSLPIVLLTCGLVGLMLAYMGGAQLGRIGAQGFLADVVAVGMVRELAGLMTAVILAGRVGSAFAAQLATMQAGEEIDALRVLGVDPITHLVLPRLLALLLMAPALMACGALAGVAGRLAAGGAGLRRHTGRILAPGAAGAELHPPVDRPVQGHALRGPGGGGRLPRGLHAGRSAQAVGEATTTAVVKALVWVVAAATGTTMVFTNLGLDPPPKRLRRSPSRGAPVARQSRIHGPRLPNPRHRPVVHRVQVRGLAIQAGGRTVQQGLDVRRAARRGAGHHGRQRLRQEHAAAPPGGPGPARRRQRVDRWRGSARRQRRRAGRAAAPLRRDVPGRRAVELDEPGPQPDAAVALFTTLDAAERERRARFKLALVGLDGAFDLAPAALSGGMRKRAALARALALDPTLLFLDEPGAGLDPVNAARLDELVLNLRHHLGTTVVMVTHEIASVFAVADRALFLDDTTKTMTALGPPQDCCATARPPCRPFCSMGHPHERAGRSPARIPACKRGGSSGERRQRHAGRGLARGCAGAGRHRAAGPGHRRGGRAVVHPA